MLEIKGGRNETRARATRRSFMRVGALTLGGLTLADVLRLRADGAEEAGRGAGSDTAVIQIVLGGGPSHIDTYDPKPDAPREFRGEFAAIPTNTPGVYLSEMMPRQAKIMDKLAVVRSLRHTTSDHNAGMHWVMTGFPATDPGQSANTRPSVGSIAAKLRGANAPGLPPYVSLNGAQQFANASYLGPGSNPFEVAGDPRAAAKPRNIELPGGLTFDRVEDRRALLSKLDRIERARDAGGVMEGMDHFTREAYAMITGPAARRAFDLTQEQARVRARYGDSRVGQSCLLARRLVEAGVTFVTIREGNWDHHAQVFQNCRRMLPELDAAVASLVEDLHERGLAERVMLLVWGEFGRTPRVNGTSGRDHWPGAMSALVAGGGLNMGRAVGATTRKGEYPVDHPLGPEDMLQTVYHVLGIDPRRQFFNEAGRPMAVLNVGRPIDDLTG